MGRYVDTQDSNVGTPTKHNPKLFVQVAAEDLDRAALRDKPTVTTVLSGVRYHGIITAGAGQMLELHITADTARLLLEQISAKLDEIAQ